MAVTYNSALVDGFFYTLLSERGDKKPFKVKLRAIDSIALAQLQDGLLLRNNNDVSLRTGTYNVNVCRLAIVGWENMQDLKGKEIEITLTKAGTISDESLKRIPAYFFDEISNVAVSVSNDPTSLQMYLDAAE